MKIYALLGLAGCCGSMDATNVIWIQVPKMHSNAAAGEKGKGLLINVVCDHNKEVIFVQPYWYIRPWSERLTGRVNTLRQASEMIISDCRGSFDVYL